MIFALRRSIAAIALLLNLAQAQDGAATADERSRCCVREAGFDPIAAAYQATTLSTRSWEYGTAAEALLELHTPELSVFYQGELPPNVSSIADVPALSYIKPHIRLDNQTLVDGNGSSGDPASLGNFALLIGQTVPPYLKAAVRQFVHFSVTPQWSNGALSSRVETKELWSDFIGMAPPFIAYYSPAFETDDAVRFALKQCLLYREALKSNSSSQGLIPGAWQHILGGENEDKGLWSTGNGWAAMGMARVLATLMHWQPTSLAPNPQNAQKDLFAWIGEILNATMSASKDDGLLRNYLDDATWFGEISGTALLTATVYRLAVLQEEATLSLFVDGETQKPVTVQMLKWANENLKAVAAHVDKMGIASPTVNPMAWGDRQPYTHGSPEGQSFLVMLYSAWRDCVENSVCSSKL